MDAPTVVEALDKLIDKHVTKIIELTQTKDALEVRIARESDFRDELMSLRRVAVR